VALVTRRPSSVSVTLGGQARPAKKASVRSQMAMHAVDMENAILRLASALAVINTGAGLARRRNAVFFFQHAAALGNAFCRGKMKECANVIREAPVWHASIGYAQLGTAVAMAFAMSRLGSASVSRTGSVLAAQIETAVMDAQVMAHASVKQDNANAQKAGDWQIVVSAPAPESKGSHVRLGGVVIQQVANVHVMGIHGARHASDYVQENAQIVEGAIGQLESVSARIGTSAGSVNIGHAPTTAMVKANVISRKEFASVLRVSLV